MMFKKIFCLVIFSCSFLWGQKENNVELISPSNFKADIDSLISELILVHPTFSDYYKKNNIAEKIDSIKETITESKLPADFFRIMQPIIAIDGHTTLMFNDKGEAKIQDPFFPFKVVIYNNKLFVKKSLMDLNSIFKGDFIESIDNMPSEQIINHLVKYIHGEKRDYKLKILEGQFHNYYRMVYGQKENFSVTISGKKYKLKGVNYLQFQQESKPKFELKFYENDIAYLYFRKFKAPKDFLSFMDSSFNILAKKKIKYLVIDNQRGGGMTDLADSLLAYFAKKPYLLLDKKMTKVSPLTKQFLDSKKDKGEISDDFFNQDFIPHVVKKENKFLGKVYILNSISSYSTASCFAAAAKCYTDAVLIGEETGQPLISNGDMNRFKLNNSGIYCFTSLSKVFMPCNNGDNISGVKPHFSIHPTLKDLLEDRDYILEYTLSLIENEEM